jgi:hypothetical protein
VGLPAPVNSLTDVACPTPTRCWATGSTVGGAGAPNGAAVIATINGGATWTPQVIPATVGYLSGIACSNRLRCVAVGQAALTSNGQAAVITTVDGGTTWAPAPTPPGILDLTAVSCRGDLRCMAIGTSGGGTVALVSATAGSTWVQQGALPPNTSGATDISCTGDNDCWVTAHAAVNADNLVGTVAVTTNGGTTWSAVTTPPGLGYLNGIACLTGPTAGSGALPTTTAPTPTTAAPTTGTPAATASTTTATTTAAASTTTTLPAVGVAGAHCTVVGTTATTLDGTRAGHGLVLTTDNGGARWTSQPVSPVAASLAEVSCPAIGTCAAVGSSVASTPQAGVVLLTGSSGRPWTSPSVLGSPQPLTGVSCASDAHCVVVGEAISEHLVGG